MSLAVGILNAGADGFAGMAASQLLEAQPAIAARYGAHAFGSWERQLRHWVLDLAAAVSAGEDQLFVARMAWVRDSFAAREAPVADLLDALDALRDVLRERLPESARDEVMAVLDAGRTAAQAPPTPVAAPAIGKPALAYVARVLEGNPRTAIDELLALVDGGMPVRDAYLDVLLPAQREAGRLWHAAEMTVAEEHLVTSTTRRAMSLLCERARPAQQIGRCVLLACVAGNAHDLPLGAAADFFEMAGWRVINLGGDVPAPEIGRGVTYFKPELLVLATALLPQIATTRATIAHIRPLANEQLRILVGGPAFEHAPDLWQDLGADACAPAIESIEALGRRITD